MLVGLLAVVMAVVAVGVVFASAARRAGRAYGTIALRVAQGSALVFILSIALYQKPESFYVNFVILPSLFLFLGGLGCVFVTLVLGVIALVKGDGRRQAVIAMAGAVLSAVATFVIILWRAGQLTS